MANIVDFLDYLWGIPLTLFIVVAGLYFSKCINFIQFKNPKLIIKNTIGKIKNNNSYRTITSVLGGTIGSGNIAGIATAIAIGGPGTVFWMWFVALLSMATKMVEVTLAVYYQKNMIVIIYLKNYEEIQSNDSGNVSSDHFQLPNKAGHWSPYRNWRWRCVRCYHW